MKKKVPSRKRNNKIKCAIIGRNNEIKISIMEENNKIESTIRHTDRYLPRKYAQAQSK